jgi:predicted NAD/FAD-dependent oxidoreductase
VTLNVANPVARIAILGGGYTGAIVAMNLARYADQTIQVTVIEPRTWLGGGVAYSTPDPAHRVNSQSTRMSAVSEDQLHFDRWIRDNRAIDDDPEAALPDARIFPRRLVFGTYVREQLARCLRGSAIEFSHVQDTATSVRRYNGTWVIATAGGDNIEADLILLDQDAFRFGFLVRTPAESHHGKGILSAATIKCKTPAAAGAETGAAVVGACRIRRDSSMRTRRL